MTDVAIRNEEVSSGIVYFELEGYLDANSFETLEEAFETYFSRNLYRIIVGIGHLKYISSAGAGVFIGAVGVAQENGGNIVLVQPVEEVREVFELLGVYQLFPVVDTKDEAREQFGSSHEAAP